MAGGAVDLDKMASKSTERNQQPQGPQIARNPLALMTPPCGRRPYGDILTTKRRLEIEALTRELFERYRRYVGNLCGEEMSPRACLPVQVDWIIFKALKDPASPN